VANAEDNDKAVAEIRSQQRSARQKLPSALNFSQATFSPQAIEVHTLNMLAPGQTAKVVCVSGVDGISSRLREMGFVPGEVVRLLRLAPLGDPLKCMIHGSRIALRNREAARVVVSPQ